MHCFRRKYAALLAAAFLLTSCLSPAAAPESAVPFIQPYLIQGSYQVTNDFVLTRYYTEHAVGLVDMHGFVIRDAAWELPLESQVLGYASFDPSALSGTYQLNLPLLPRGTFNDVDNNGAADQGVQIYAVAYFPNLHGGPFSNGFDHSQGWPTYLSSAKTNPENGDEVTGGKLVVWSPDARQLFPSGFGADGLLFTADDPLQPLEAGYSIVDMDQSPFMFSRETTPEITLYEPVDVATKDFSAQSYTQAFDAMFDVVRKEYAFGDVPGKSPDWDALYASILPRIKAAEENASPNEYYLALRDFTRAFRDGHVSLSAGDYGNNDFQTAISGGYGFAIRELDDGRVFAVFVLEGGPAQSAGMQQGAEILEFNGMPISDAISAVIPYSIQSSDFAIRYQQARYLLATQPGQTAQVKFLNPDGEIQTATLTAIAEQQSFGRTSVNYGADRSSMLPVDSRIITTGADRIGYVRVNSNADDLNLTVRLFERALQNFQSLQLAGIIIDMRYNTGGSLLGLAGFLTNQPIEMGQIEYFSNETGNFEPKGPREVIHPAERIYSFEKQVLLIGQACFSACEIEAYAFSRVPGMIVVGQTSTAGSVSDIARGRFKMPEGFELTIPTGRLTAADGSIFLEGQGVQPTLRVPVDETTAFSTDDVVFQKGLEAALRPSGAGVVPAGRPRVFSMEESEAAFSSGSSFLEELARESYDSAALSQPGTVSYSVALTPSSTALWGYVWCADRASLLPDNMEKIQLNFVLDGEKIPAENFATYETETGGRFCQLTYIALGDWPPGEHHLVTAAVFAEPVNDGTIIFSAGEYVRNYSVFVKP